MQVAAPSCWSVVVLPCPPPPASHRLPQHGGHPAPERPAVSGRTAGSSVCLPAHLLPGGPTEKCGVQCWRRRVGGKGGRRDEGGEEGGRKGGRKEGEGEIEEGEEKEGGRKEEGQEE